MPRDSLLELEGTVEDAMGGGKYKIRLDTEKGAPRTVIAQLSGRMKSHHIRVIPGDRVRVGLSPYDLGHGLIVYRSK